MKPAHLCHIFPAFGTGGAQVRTATVINGLNGEFRHTVIALNGDLSCRSRVSEPEKLTYLAAPSRPKGMPHSLALARLLKSIHPDLVVTYNWGGTDGLVAARLCGIRRVIHAEDGFGPDEAQGQKLRRILARRVLLRTASQVVCPSRTLLRIARQVWVLPPGKVLYLPNGVDTRRFAPAAPAEVEAFRQKLGIRPGELVVGSVGQLRGEKNYERLVRAFAQAAGQRSGRLLLVGDGPLREPLGRLVRHLALEERVVFAGVVTDPAPCYQVMDVFALSSDTEQMPIAVLEAMAMGLPVVSTDVGDVRAMLSAGNRAYVVPPANAEAYAARLAALLDDAAARRALGTANRARCIEDFEVRDMVQAYQRLYRHVLEASR